MAGSGVNPDYPLGSAQRRSELGSTESQRVVWWPWRSWATASDHGRPLSFCCGGLPLWRAEYASATAEQVRNAVSDHSSTQLEP